MHAATPRRHARSAASSGSVTDAARATTASQPAAACSGGRAPTGPPSTGHPRKQRHPGRQWNQHRRGRESRAAAGLAVSRWRPGPDGPPYIAVAHGRRPAGCPVEFQSHLAIGQQAGSSRLRRRDRARHGQRQAHWYRGLVHELQDHRSARSVTHRGRPLDHVSAGHPHGCGRDRHGVHQPGPHRRLLCGDVPAVPGAHGPTDPPARPEQRDSAGAVRQRPPVRPGRRAAPWAEGPPRPSTRGRLRGPPDQRWPAGSAWRRLTSGFRSSAGGRAGRDRPRPRGAPPR